MKQIKRTVFSIVLSLTTVFVYSQALISTTDGKFYWVNGNTENLSKLDVIGAQEGRRVVRIPVTNVVTVEDMEHGLEILQSDKLKKIPAVAFEDNIESFFAQGKKVYIPLASGIIQQRWGAKRLIELMMESDYWHLVACDEEADFIMEYVFDDKGSDHAYLLFSDRSGNKVLSTWNVAASDFVPVHAGEESAEELFDTFLKRKFFLGKMAESVHKTQKANKSNHGSLYYTDKKERR